MLANNNLKVCFTLVKRDVRFHRIKNLALILAAALVTGLYTFVFLLGNAVESGFLLSYQYSYGSTSHILFTGLTEEQAGLLSQHVYVKSAVKLSTLGQLSDPMMGQRLVKLAVTDRDYAETVLSLPTTGHLPEKEGEIALDEFTMGSLGIRYEIGAPVALEWTDPDGNVHRDEFTLCGWWSSPTNFSEACAWITAETAEHLVPGYNDENSANITLGVTLHQPRDLEQQAVDMLSDQGIPTVAYTTNLANNEARREQAFDQAKDFYMPAILVLVCGFLMVYGIVHVTAEQDQIFFAGLKAQGMTPRQIRRYLWEKGVMVTGIGLIPGFLLGFLLNLAITGRIVTGMEEDPAVVFLTWQPFALAAFCTLATVLIAYLLPAVRLSQRTPAEILRGSSPRKRRGRGKEDGMITLPRLAFRTFGQGKGRTALSVCIMLLAVLLLNSVWMEYVSMDEELYLSAMSPWDYSIADGSAAMSMQRYNQNSESITEETVETIRNRPEVTSVSALKSHEVKLTASETLRKRVVDFYNQPYDETMTLRETQEGYPGWIAGLDRLAESGEYTAVVIGMEGEYLNYLMENCPATSGEFDPDAFAEGRFVLVGGAYYDGISSLAAGETLQLEGRDFEVMASLMHDASYLSGSNSTDAAFTFFYILPLSVFDELYPGQPYRQMAVDIDHSQQDSFEAFLEEFEQGLNRGIGITLRSEYQENLRNARLNTVLVPLIVGLVLMGIALLNFGNLLVAKVFARRQEFAVYQSLGMTGEQLKKLMILEGILYSILMALVLIPADVLFARIVMPGVIRDFSWASVYHFTLLPLWIALPVMILLAMAVPLLCLHAVTKGTIQERLRMME